MKNFLISIVILHALLCCIHAMGYEQETHVKLSEEAAKASVLYKSDANVLSNLGLKPIDDRSQRFSNSKNEFKTINELIQDGGNFEDNFPRSTNHFFNPVNSQALSLFGGQVGNPSPDWALEDKGQIVGGMVLGGQEYSYRDGRLYFYLALTSSSSVERDKRWGQMFQTLGQVIHHIQDMAQPQPMEPI